MQALATYAWTTSRTWTALAVADQELINIDEDADSASDQDMEDQEETMESLGEQNMLKQEQAGSSNVTTSLFKVPNELLEMVFGNLSISDVFHLAQTCRKMNDNVLPWIYYKDAHHPRPVALTFGTQKLNAGTLARVVESGVSLNTVPPLPVGEKGPRLDMPLIEALARRDVNLADFLLMRNASANMYSPICKKRPLDFVLNKAIKARGNWCPLNLVRLLVQHEAVVSFSTRQPGFANHFGMLMKLAGSMCRIHPDENDNCVVEMMGVFLKRGLPVDMALSLNKVFNAYRPAVARVLVNAGVDKEALGPYLP